MRGLLFSLEEGNKKSPSSGENLVRKEDLVNLNDVLSPGAAFAIGRLEFDLFALFSGMIAFHHKRREVEEVVDIVLAVDKAEALVRVEHLDGSLHGVPLFLDPKVGHNIAL